MNLDDLQNLPTLEEFAGLDDARLLISKQRADDLVRRQMNRGTIGLGGRYYAPGYGESIETAFDQHRGRQMQDAVAEIQAQLQHRAQTRETDAIAKAFPTLPRDLPADLRKDILAAMRQAEDQQFRTSERTASQSHDLSRDKARFDADIALRRTPSVSIVQHAGSQPGSPGSPSSPEFAGPAPQVGIDPRDDSPIYRSTRTGQLFRFDATGQPVVHESLVAPRPSAQAEKASKEAAIGVAGIDDAIAEVARNPHAMGLINAVPGMDTVRQFTDPEGIPARASVANIGSLKLHDRSGAAVTISEFPRLRPFIPSPSDRPEAATAKLQKLKDEYRRMQAEWSGQASASLPTIRNSDEWQRLAPGTRYRLPDGREGVR